MNSIETDVAVIGAGPVGLFAVFALGQVGLGAVVVDALHETGGQCAALYPDKPIYDIPSRPSITGAALIEDLLAQAAPYAPVYLCGRRVESCVDKGGRFELGLSDGSRLRAGAVLIAAGAGAFGPNRPPIDGIENYEGTSIFYSVRTPERFRERHVVIAGGGDSAADWAVFLADVAASVTVIHRRSNFRAAPATIAQIRRLSEEGRIRIVAPGALHALEGEGSQISTVLVDNGCGEILRFGADALLCFFGLSKDLSAISAWGIGADRHGIRVEPMSMSTMRAGIFAVGDIAHYPGKLKLILTGFAEATTAAHQARAHLKPDEAFHFSYSTSRGQPGLATLEARQ
jgi:thioredoxin reductase (NADPH)